MSIYLGPDARDPLDTLAADPRVRLSASGSWLNRDEADES